MSFPSAISWLQQQGIDLAVASEEDAGRALMHAVEKDTPIGYCAMTSLILAQREAVPDPVSFIRQRLAASGFATDSNDVLRGKWIASSTVKVDFHPDSALGRQFARLNTDAVRSLIEAKFGIALGFLNCCGGVASDDPKKIKQATSPKNQVLAQVSIDC